mgnify:CR=1 FL=1
MEIGEGERCAVRGYKKLGPFKVGSLDRNERELDRPEYNRAESFVAKGLGWLMDRLNGLIEIMPGSNGLSTLMLGVVLGVVAVAIFFAVRGTSRSRRLADRTSGPVLDEPGLSAEEIALGIRAALAAIADNSTDIHAAAGRED